MKKIIWHISSNPWHSAVTHYAFATMTVLKDWSHIFMPPAHSTAAQVAQSLAWNVAPVPSFHSFSLWKKRLQAKPQLMIFYEGQETVLSKFFPPSIPKIRFLGRDLKRRIFLSTLGYRHLSALVLPGWKNYEVYKNLFPSQKFCVIPLGLDSKIWTSSQKDWRPKNPKVLIFGRLDPIKGHRKALSIFSKLLNIWSKNIPLPTLHICGLEARISRWDILRWAQEEKLPQERLHLQIEKVSPQELYQTSTLTWVPSLGSEHLARVTTESLLCGTPVFLSSAGFLSETLFPQAGLCYGLSSDPAAWLKIALEKAYYEPWPHRLQRSKRAALHHGLAPMERAWDDLLESIF